MIIERTVDTKGNVLKEEIIKEQSPWMTIQEAASFLRVSDHTIHEYARQKKLRKFRVSDFNTIRVKRVEVEALLQPYEEAFDQRA